MMHNHPFSSMLAENDPLSLWLYSAGYAKVGPDWFGSVMHPTVSRLYYILEGEFYLRLADGSVRKLRSGHIYLLPSGFSFEFGCEKEMRHFYFHVQLSGEDRMDLLAALGQPLEMEMERKASDYEELFRNETAADSLRIRSEIYERIYRFLISSGIEIRRNQYSSEVSAAIRYIGDHLSIKLSIPEIASACFTASSTLTRHFQSETGLTIRRYIDLRIMSAAERMILSGERSMREISETFGFCDQFYFSRRFREILGKTPREYAKTTRA